MESYLKLPKISPSDIVEIIIIAFLVYQVMKWIKKTRAWTLLKGLVVLLIMILVASFFNLTTILWIANKAFSVGIIAIVIVFQPELRQALEQLGRRKYIGNIFPQNGTTEEGRFSDKTIARIVDATFSLAKEKTGALIVIEQDITLEQFEHTGIKIDAAISSQLFINIFEHNTPLHDGAVIVRGDRIVAATCYLPLSDNMDLSKELGTRHRAGVGISEITDSLVIIVSEETGKVSIAQKGELLTDIDTTTLKGELVKVQNKKQVTEKKRIMLGKGRGQNYGRKAENKK
ncbi:MAG: diadenylate cyclase CdaA [Eubacterium sp.]